MSSTCRADLSRTAAGLVGTDTVREVVVVCTQSVRAIGAHPGTARAGGHRETHAVVGYDARGVEGVSGSGGDHSSGDRGEELEHPLGLIYQLVGCDLGQNFRTDALLEGPQCVGKIRSRTEGDFATTLNEIHDLDERAAC